MHDFARMLLLLLEQSALLALAVSLIGILILMAVYRIHRNYSENSAQFPWKKSILFLALAAYGVIVIYITLLRGPGGEYRYVNIHLFEAWRHAWRAVSPRGWINILLNILLFMPLGVLLPQISDLFQRWSFTMTIGLTLSLVIELLQLITGRGIFDVDDLSANFLGTALGFCIVKSLYILSDRKSGKRAEGTLWLLPPVTFLFLLLVLGGSFYGQGSWEKAVRQEQVRTEQFRVASVCPFQLWTDRSIQLRKEIEAEIPKI